MKYNFYVLGYELDYYKIIYQDIMKTPDSYYLAYPVYKKYNLIRTLIRICLNSKYSKYISSFIKEKLFLYIFRNVSHNKPICFLIFSRIWLESLEKQGLLEFLRKQYPNCKLVCYFHDLVETHKLNIDNIKKKMDLTISYDYNEAKKYQIDYYPTPFSSIPNIIPKKDNYDFYFLGSNKGRLSKLIKICTQIKQQYPNAKCNINIVEQNPKEAIPDFLSKEIHFQSPITYIQNLQFVNQSKIVIELMQPNAVGATLRIWEAIYFSKKIITDNSYIKNMPFYNPSNILLISDIENLIIPKEFLETKADYGEYKNNLSPTLLLKHIDSQL